MAIDARLLVLDEPTLGLDILYRKQFYDSLLNDYFDRNRTIVVTTHQVEEIQHVLTDVMFIDRGRIVFDCSMEELESRYLEVMVHPEQVAAARALKPMHERQVFGRSILLFDLSSMAWIVSNSPRLATCARPASPTCSLRCWADKPGNQAGQAQGAARMNTQSNAMSESPLESQVSRACGHLRRAGACTGRCDANCGRTARSTSRRWRSLASLLFGFSDQLDCGYLGRRPLTARSGATVKRSRTTMAAGLMMLTGIVVSVFYCLDALHGERRDRSILFWKSLPVSDLTTVLAKASIPLVILPLLTFAITVAMQWLMLLISSVVLLVSGQSVATLWTELSFLRRSWLLLYHLLTVHALWSAPIYCWLLLVSGWARRATFLWAALPLVAIAGVEQIAFHTWHFAALVGSRLIGDAPTVASTSPDMFPTDR